MKRIINIIYLLLLVAIIIMNFFAPINQFILISKNIFVFLFIALTIYTFTTYWSKLLIKKYSPTGTKETLVYVGRVLTFGILLVSFSAFQYNYIQFSGVPFAEGCKYYDQYNNLIYQSEFYESTPELSIRIQDEFNLGFDVEESYILEGVDSIVGDDDISGSNATLELYRLTTVDIQYNIEHKITSVDYKVSQYNNTLSDTYKQTNYYSYNQLINNSYYDQFESSMNESVYQERFDYIVTDELSHHDFISEDYTTIRYYIEDGYESENDILYHLVKDYRNDEGDFINEEVASINYITHDDSYEYLIIPTKDDDINLNITVDIVFKDNQTSYSYVESKNPFSFYYQTTYSSLMGYRNIAIMRSDQTYLSPTEMNSNKVYFMEVFKQSNNSYLIQKQTNSIKILPDYTDSLFQIFDMDYGHKVVNLKYRDRSYIDYLINGELPIDPRVDIYFDRNFSLGSSNTLYKQFDVEYQLKNNKMAHNTLYCNFPFLIFE
ncbi:MAG: hypothetical protein ABII85_06290 [Bacillota bacterium]